MRASLELVIEPVFEPPQEAQGEPDLFLEYCRSQEFDPVGPLGWLAREGFQAPLLPGWVEEVREPTYFVDTWLGTTAWEPPLDRTYRDLYRALESGRSLAELEREVARQALEGLDGWDGPYQSEQGPYWHCSARKLSIWENPNSRVELTVEVIRRSRGTGKPPTPKRPDGRWGSPSRARTTPTPGSHGTGADSPWGSARSIDSYRARR